MALALFGAGIGYTVAHNDPVPTATAGDAVAPPNIFAKIARDQSPAVVNISTKEKVVSPSHPGVDDERLREFYGRNFPGFREPKERRRASLGSGFVIGKEGFILTNYHVVKEADEIVVSFSNGAGHGSKEKEYGATLIGADPKTDIALIKIEPGHPLPVLTLGDSDKLQVGEWVIAIGNPFGFSGSVTVGVVSAKGREIGAGPYDDFIQTDASINPGNSGGPLLNTAGEVIGINTAIYTGGMTAANIGIGFAVPINMVKEIIGDLKQGKVKRGWLGVVIQPVTPEVKEAFGLPRQSGALVGDVVEGSPAVKAGVRRGDVIVSFDGEEVATSADLPRMVGMRKPGEQIALGLFRDGGEKRIGIKLGEMPTQEEMAPAREEEQGSGALGMTVEDITPQLARRLELDDTKGVIVTQVTPGGPAATAGLRPRDVILEVKRKPVTSAADFEKIVAAAQPGESLALLLRRGKTTQFSVLSIPTQAP
jgi:serine protease Do